MAQDAIHLLFDVEGGENLDSGSGKEILRQLTSIVNQINGSSRLPKINIEFNASGAIDALKKELAGVSGITGDLFNWDKTIFGDMNRQLASIAESSRRTMGGVGATFARVGSISETASQALEKLDEIFEAIPDGVGGSGKAIEKITKNIADLVDKLEDLQDIVGEISRKPTSVINNIIGDGKTEDLQRLELLKKKAQETIKTFEPLAALMDEAYSRGRIDSKLMNQLTPLSADVERLKSSSAENMLAISDAESAEEVKKIAQAYDALNGKLVQIYRTYNKSHNAEIFTLPDMSELRDAHNALVEYDKTVQSMAGGAQEVTPSTAEEQSILDKAQQINEACGAIEERLARLRQVIEATFDFGSIKPDISNVEAALEKLTEAAAKVKVTVVGGGNRQNGGGTSQEDAGKRKAQAVAFAKLNDAVREYFSLKRELSKVEKGVAQDGDKWKTEGKEGEVYEKRVARINELIDSLQTLGITSQSASRLFAQSDDEKKKSAESLGISLDQYEKILERVIETERRQGIDAEREASHQYDANAFKEKSAQLKEYFKLLKDLDKYKMKDGTLSGGAGKEFEGKDPYKVRIKLINECREALKELKIEFNDDGVVVKPTPKDIETQAKSLKMSAEEYRALIDLAVKNSREFAVAHEKNSASVQESWTKNAQKAHDYIQRLKDVGAHMNDNRVANLIDEVEKILAGGDTKNLTELQGKVSQLREAVVKSGADIETWGHKVSRALGSQLRSALAGFVTGIISKAIRDVYNNVVALDSAITDLQIATGKTREETAELVKEYSNLAKQLGATTAEVAKSADTWLRQGYSIEQTNTLIRNSTMLAKLGQMESAEAAKALTSAMKGYKVEVEDSIGIVDKFTAVDMEAAVSAGDIATAMAETAASADIAGVSMDRLIGYIATVAEVTQDGAESVGKEIAQQYGNILKVGNNIGQRLGTVKTEVTLCNKKSAA